MLHAAKSALRTRREEPHQDVDTLIGAQGAEVVADLPEAISADGGAMSSGERRHETCRYGTLTASWVGDGLSGKWEPGVSPMCCWRVPEPCPPAVKRAWGGNIVEFDRDCAVCPAHDPLSQHPTPTGEA